MCTPPKTPIISRLYTPSASGYPGPSQKHRILAVADTSRSLRFYSPKHTSYSHVITPQNNNHRSLIDGVNKLVVNRRKWESLRELKIKCTKPASRGSPRHAHMAKGTCRGALRSVSHPRSRHTLSLTNDGNANVTRLAVHHPFIR